MCCSSGQELWGSSPSGPGRLEGRRAPPETGVKCAALFPPVDPPPQAGPSFPAHTTIAFIHADVEVAAEGRGIDNNG